jgi:hypothetical protein
LRAGRSDQLSSSPLFLWKEEVAPLSLRAFRAISSVVDHARIATRSVAGGALGSAEFIAAFSLERRSRAIIVAGVSRD